MTNAESYAATGLSRGEIDPSWWSAVLVDDQGTQSLWQAPELMSGRLAALAAEARTASGADSLHARVLTLLATATSPMLVSDSWTEPYQPAIQLRDGRRTPVPDDMTPADLALLALLTPHIEQSSLKARVADIAWFYGDRTNLSLLSAAIGAYLSTPLNFAVWAETGRESWRRGLDLAARRGKAGQATVEQAVASLVDCVLSLGVTARFMPVQISKLLSEFKRFARPHAQSLADHLVAVAAAAIPDHDLSRALEREAARWFSALDETVLKYECVERVAQRYVDEADIRLATGGGAMLEGNFIEQAVATLRTLPRKYRAERGLDVRLDQLLARLAGARQRTVEEMAPIEFGPFDLSQYVIDARRAVTGKSHLEALANLAGIVPLPDRDAAIAAERERLSGSLIGLFGMSTYSGDGRKVASRAGFATSPPSDDELFNEAVRTFTLSFDIAVKGRILPALEAATFEHRYGYDFLAAICQESPVIETSHAGLWARGLQHGFGGDFPSAISLLVPQVEHLVRRWLKASGVNTIFMGENGIETEKGLNALLEIPETSDIFGGNLVFVLRCLLCEQSGPNLRNDLAHGLLTDGQAWSAASVYAWWICLRLAVLPFFHVRHQQRDVSGGDAEAVPADETPRK